MSESQFDPVSFLKNLTRRPGVYRLFDERNALLYVGKAKNLKQRVKYYFQKTLSGKWNQLQGKIRSVEVTVTRSETEALLLERSLIRSLKPKYNVLLQDNKSYPWLLLLASPFPSLRIHRGPRIQKGTYFGPLASLGAARMILNFVKRIFKIRQCTEATFRNRSKPCLQYDLGNCTAPCVQGYVSDSGYKAQVTQLESFLSGETQTAIKPLIKRMQLASERDAFEEAAELRDQIKALSALGGQQAIQSDRLLYGDLLTVASAGDRACINQLIVRNGEVVGSFNHDIETPLDLSVSEILESFILDFYAYPVTEAMNAASSTRCVQFLPPALLLLETLPSKKIIEQTLKQSTGRTVKVITGLSAQRYAKDQLALSSLNAKSALSMKQLSSNSFKARFAALKMWTGLARMEIVDCIDISHTQGAYTVGGFVRFTEEGPVVSEFHTCNLTGIKSGDDYAAMIESISHRYEKSAKARNFTPPDLLLIDGGLGQLNAIQKLFAAKRDVWKWPPPYLMAVSKGPSRKPGIEQLWRLNAPPITLDPHSPILHCIQIIRDAAHHHAVLQHRKRRQKGMKTVPALSHIPGLGQVRTQRLLVFLGGLRALRGASILEIAKVPGISAKLAGKIYEALHRDVAVSSPRPPPVDAVEVKQRTEND